MKKNALKIFALNLVFSIVIAGCGNNQTPPAAEAPAASENAQSAGETNADPNIKADTAEKEVTYLAEVNAKYFTEPTRHGIVFKDGGNGEKSVLRGLGDEKVFYDAMMSVGFAPSNELTIEDMKKGVNVEGEPLDVYVTWEGLGKEIPFSDIIKSSEPRPMDLRFGGNLENAKDKNTGCVLCLDSCAVGITSDAAYETGASETIQFFGNSDVLPADGTQVTVIFRARGTQPTAQADCCFQDTQINV